jgi:hypothetical protein
MIILTAAEADDVRGRSPLTDFAAIHPRPLKDGTYMLHEDVISDPAHADVSEFLASLPTVEEVDPALIYDKDETPPSDTDWQDAGPTRRGHK